MKKESRGLKKGYCNDGSSRSITTELDIVER